MWGCENTHGRWAGAATWGEGRRLGANSAVWVCWPWCCSWRTPAGSSAGCPDRIARPARDTAPHIQVNSNQLSRRFNAKCPISRVIELQHWTKYRYTRCTKMLMQSFGKHYLISSREMIRLIVAMKKFKEIHVLSLSLCLFDVANIRSDLELASKFRKRETKFREKNIFALPASLAWQTRRWPWS